MAQGLGVALLPQLALDSYRRPDVAVRGIAEVGQRRLFLVRHRETVQLPSVAATARAVRHAHNLATR